LLQRDYQELTHKKAMQKLFALASSMKDLIKIYKISKIGSNYQSLAIERMSELV